MNRKENLDSVLEKISRAANRCGRNPLEIKLLAVSKVFPVEDILDVYNLGIRSFGESRAQELRDKAPQMPENIEWHFIGPLQINKIKYVVPNAGLIHAVDSLKLAQAIASFGARKEIVPKILVEINTSDEEAKHGFSQNKAIEAALEINEIENLDVQGLMTMAARTEDQKEIRSSFAKLKKIQLALQNQSENSFNELSMGMSGDFEIAIEEGSTIVRVGTGIFGPRRRQ
ncbi:MAG: YggS family pyridoxal phosphate-dependent enzyme [Calditrichaeota bacterium]|nr:MAG: YggS family pyridoxal phosphate-dependent enzyme [Calditrichota bacterium]MBL1204412.1 YggS family pyridoxal phosphate-dependent enzyme [Calditrichota bacterium]NOG44241.1 YggS family pyridoxal phosphate-dependent enzyme [Calditrichota bacterium]